METYLNSAAGFKGNAMGGTAEAQEVMAYPSMLVLSVRIVRVETGGRGMKRSARNFRVVV